MSNPLTGDFDLVAEFAVLAVDRVLAAMHSNDRFLHSIAARIDDNAPPGTTVTNPVFVGSVDVFGDPIVNQRSVGNPGRFLTTSLSPCDSTAVDRLVNLGELTSFIPPVVPSKFQGVVQMQLFPPTITIPDSSGSKVTVHLEVMSRYFPDPNSPPLAEFVRGTLAITAAVNQISSQSANVIDFDFKSDQAFVSFTPTFSSTPLTAQDIAGINLAIHNALRTSFLPSNATLPASIAYAQLKTFTGVPGGVAVLLNAAGATGPGNPASMNSAFLALQDHFAVAVSRDFLAKSFQPAINGILNQPAQSITIPIDLAFTTVHVVYSISMNSASFDLQNGKIVLTVQGHAQQTSNKWYAPDNFDFTAIMDFTLQIDGSTANLIAGDVSLDTTSWIVNLFRNSATSGIKQARDQALAQSGANATVRTVLDANQNLGGFFTSLLSSAKLNLIDISDGQHIALAYTAVDISPSGIVLHGSLTVTYSARRAKFPPTAAFAAVPPVGAWRDPYVEFEQIPPNGQPSGNSLQNAPQYSALKSWIPGGTIDSYEWRFRSETDFEQNRFVYVQPPPVLSDGTAPALPLPAFLSACLTVRGTRLSPAGPVVPEAVTAFVCAYSVISVVSATLSSSFEGTPPTIALTQSDDEGHLTVTGHTLAPSDPYGLGTPNLLVHFANDQSARNLRILTDALFDSKRSDVNTAVVVVMSAEQLANSTQVTGIIYGEDHGGDWSRLFKQSGSTIPSTIIVNGSGAIVWQQAGPPDQSILAAALAKYLGPSGSSALRLFQSNLTTRQPAPNFVFEYSPGSQLALRKLAGQATVLVFWRSTSPPSIEAIRDFQAPSLRSDQPAPTVLAINDGEAVGVAQKVFAENKLTATLVTDPQREICSAYGIGLWPTIVYLDDSGFVTGVQHGRETNQNIASSNAKGTVSE